MKLIDVEKISYTYPIAEELEDGFESGSGKEASKEDGLRIKPSKEDAPRIKVEILPALDQASLQVEEGQFICILGRNGSGKSTLARHLNALLVPDDGTVWIDGKDTKDQEHLWDIRAMVGMVFQNPDNQIIGSVVEEDVAFGLENLGVPSEEIQRRVKQVLEQVGMSEHAKRSPNDLSGGQKQRAAIAGVLAMEPRCIVLDEATAMLDPRGRADVMRVAAQMNKEKGITIISITHYMDEALKADRVFVMDQGRIVMSGTPREVFQKEAEIEELGLQLPQVSKLASRLRKEGLSIPEGILFVEELAEALHP